jgi:hypothetical protein
MLLILVHLLLSYAYCWLTGYVAVLIFRWKPLPPPGWVILPLLGFLIHIPVLSFLSLFLPLNTYVFLSIIVLLLLFLPWRKTLFHHSIPVNNQPVKLLVFSLLAFLTLLSASLPPTLPDMWGYHAQAIQWTEKYAVVPGLGNLCSKFAFNFGSFLFLALLSMRPLTGQPLFTLNALLMIWVFGYLAFFLGRKGSAIVKMVLLLGVFAVFHYFKQAIPSTSVECTSALLLLLLFFLYLSHYGALEPNDKKRYLGIIVLLILILPVIKLTNAAYLLLVLPILRQVRLKVKWGILVAAIIIWAPWLIRNVVMTGYLLYPFPQVDVFHLEWAVNKASAWDDYHWIRSWGRIPYLSSREVLQMPFLSWARVWAKTAGFFFWFFAVSGILVSTAVALNRKSASNISRGLKAFWLVTVVNVILWFLIAPDPRFIITSLILIVLIPSLSIASTFETPRLIEYEKAFLTGLTCILISLELFLNGPSFQGHWLEPSRFPRQEMITVSVDGITIYTPARGVNCYDYPVPCAPKIIPGLQPRGNSLQKGFIHGTDQDRATGKYRLLNQ